MSIPMPPLPRYDKVYSNRWGNGSDATYWYSPETLRARDIEVARVVLEAAAECCEQKRMIRGGEVFGAEVRALRIEGETP